MALTMAAVALKMALAAIMKLSMSVMMAATILCMAMMMGWQRQ